MEYRKEHDSLGERDVPAEALWGAHTERALGNFGRNPSGRTLRLVQALAYVKKACCQANLETGYLEEGKAEAILRACDELIGGQHAGQFPLSLLQGGAGTSMNMNVNEVIANRALTIMGREPGEYGALHPIDDVNMHQSTNDVFPTAVRLAVLFGLQELERAIAVLQGVFQKKEKEFAAVVKIGRTELQEAVPMTLGAEFSAFAEALARDRWRVFKCGERIRTLNLGGTAVGTGLTAPRSYIFIVVEKLRELTGLGLVRGENLVDQTANGDSLVETAGMLEAHASTLIKTCGDLRLLNMLGEIRLRPLQAGSSLMPGKVNPVIAEYALQASLRAASDCRLVFEAASRSTLQINEFMPLLADSLLEALELLLDVDRRLAPYVADTLADEERCRAYLYASPSLMTALVPLLGYEACEGLVRDYLGEGPDRPDVREFLVARLGEEVALKALSPENLMSLGFRDHGNNA